MSSEQPGRLPESVYRRRRLVVGLAVLAVIVVIVLLVVRPGSGADTKKPGANPSDKTSPGASAPASAKPDAACNPAVITLTPVTDKNSYAAGENPMISMKITNTGAVDCTLGVGTDAQLYEIVSGSDPIWNSRDCQTDAATPSEQVIKAGAELTTTPFPWDRTRSAKDTCTSSRPQVTAGGATYRLSVSLGDVKSTDDVAFLLN
ncbi:MAG: hypothetical protein DI534_04045 [Leifsonia xyli]|nr:MAG: hypothetical protein DI534_04045 [Leifsonia xyli]